MSVCATGTTERPLRAELLPYLGRHILRLGRVLRQPRGHMLLTGAAGSSRKSAARLAAFIACARLLEVRPARTQQSNQCLVLPRARYLVVRCNTTQLHFGYGVGTLHLQVDAMSSSSEAAASTVITSAVCQAGIENAKTVLLVSLRPDSSKQTWLAALSTLIVGGDVSTLLPKVEHEKASVWPTSVRGQDNCSQSIDKSYRLDKVLS